jgi:hypothetical protein
VIGVASEGDLVVHVREYETSARTRTSATRNIMARFGSISSSLSGIPYDGRHYCNLTTAAQAFGVMPSIRWASRAAGRNSSRLCSSGTGCRKFISCWLLYGRRAFILGSD